MCPEARIILAPISVGVASRLGIMWPVFALHRCGQLFFFLQHTSRQHSLTSIENNTDVNNSTTLVYQVTATYVQIIFTQLTKGQLKDMNEGYACVCLSLILQTFQKLATHCDLFRRLGHVCVRTSSSSLLLQFGKERRLSFFHDYVT